MAEEPGRVCPACRTRNRAQREYCARCSESLAATPLTLIVFEREGDPPAPRRSAWPTVALLTGAAALVVGVGWASLRHGPRPEAPPPEVFAAAAQAEAPPRRGRVTPSRESNDFVQGRRLLVGGDAAAALPLLEKAVAAEPGNALYRNVYGKALLAAGSPSRGLEELAESARLSPSAGYLLDLAKAHDQHGRYEDAAAAYERLLKDHPGDGESLRLLAALHARHGQPARAVAPLRDLVALKPADLAASQALGHALQQVGQPERAVEAYQDVLARAPQADVTRGLLAEALWEQGKREEAVEAVRSGLAARPEAPLLHRALGSLLERGGKIEEAVAEYRAYVRAAPDSPDARQLAERADALAQRTP